MPPDPPSDWRLRCAARLPPRTQIFSYGQVQSQHPIPRTSNSDGFPWQAVKRLGTYKLEYLASSDCNQRVKIWVGLLVSVSG